MILRHVYADTPFFTLPPCHALRLFDAVYATPCARTAARQRRAEEAWRRSAIGCDERCASGRYASARLFDVSLIICRRLMPHFTLRYADAAAAAARR
jgi:hypothetical protein